MRTGPYKYESLWMWLTDYGPLTRAEIARARRITIGAADGQLRGLLGKGLIERTGSPWRYFVPPDRKPLRLW